MTWWLRWTPARTPPSITESRIGADRHWRAARAEELARRCGGARTPALDLASAPVPLTDREREIVTLIGRGMSNRAIAEQLTLSVRTVESHIYRAMARCGIASRDELAALLRPGV